jgi:hypothetical protein
MSNNYIEHFIAQMPEVVFGYRGQLFSPCKKGKVAFIYKTERGLCCRVYDDFYMFCKVVDLLIACDVLSAKYKTDGSYQEELHNKEVIRIK